MKKTSFLLIVTLAFLISATALAKPGRGFGRGMGHGGPPFGMMDPDPEFMQLIAKATSLGLIQHLNLTEQQRAEMKTMLTPIREKLLTERERMTSWHSTEKQRLNDVISSLEKGEKPVADDSAIDRFEEHRKEKKETFQLMDDTLDQVLSLLTDEQKQQLTTFKPHEYLGLPRPPFGMKPLRDMAPLELLEKVRAADEEEFQMLVDHLQDRAEGKRSGLGRNKRGQGRGQGIYAQTRPERLQGLIQMLTAVRDMTDAEFEDQKATLQTDLDNLLPGRRGNGQGKGNRNGFGKGMRNADSTDGMQAPRHRKMMMKLIVLGDAFYNAL